MTYKQAVGITLLDIPENIGLTLYARLYSAVGVQVGVDLFDDFFEVGNGNYTFVYETFPDTFIGTIAFYNSVGDILLASTEINPPDRSGLVPVDNLVNTREFDIIINAGDDTTIAWRRNSSVDPTEIVFVLQEDMVNPLDEAVLVVSLTNGCEWVLGNPSGDATLATLFYDTNFIYLTMVSSLTSLFTSVIGKQQYDLKYTAQQVTKTKGHGYCSIVLGGNG